MIKRRVGWVSRFPWERYQLLWVNFYSEPGGVEDGKWEFHRYSKMLLGLFLIHLFIVSLQMESEEMRGWQDKWLQTERRGYYMIWMIRCSSVWRDVPMEGSYILSLEVGWRCDAAFPHGDKSLDQVNPDFSRLDLWLKAYRSSKQE